MIPANAIVLHSVKCSDIHKCIAGYGKATLYGVVDLGRKKFAKVFVISYMGSRVLQEKLCHLKSTCIQAKQLQYNNDIHYVLMIFIFLHIRRFCISKGGSVPLPSDMRGSTVLEYKTFTVPNNLQLAWHTTLATLNEVPCCKDSVSLPLFATILPSLISSGFVR